MACGGQLASRKLCTQTGGQQNANAQLWCPLRRRHDDNNHHNRHGPNRTETLAGQNYDIIVGFERAIWFTSAKWAIGKRKREDISANLVSVCLSNFLSLFLALSSSRFESWRKVHKVKAEEK